LSRIPAGGLYRLETRFRPRNQLAGEWSARGDMRHFVGVGDLWVVAGQSNAAGYGRDPADDPPELGVHLFRSNETWGLAAHPTNESTRARHRFTLEGSNPGHSFCIRFGKALRHALGHPIGLLQCALGGSALSAWNPREGNAPLFENMVRQVQNAGGQVRGVVWYQGESDTGSPALADSYAARFGDAVRAWREALGNPDLPVLTVQLNRLLGPVAADADRLWSKLREQQRQAAATLDRVYVVPALDLPLSDAIHTSAHGNLQLGDRLARAALGAVYGRPGAWRAPHVRTATADGERRRIVLTFDNVASRMESLDLSSIPFRVEEGDRCVAIAKVAYPGDHTILLELEQPLRGAARIHGAYGVAPPPAPMDVERWMPMLGFYGVPVS
jgi:hypothetical protein